MFAVEHSDSAGETSTKYTRAGSFTLTHTGYLVTKDGDYVLDSQNRRIQVNPLLESTIMTDGTIQQNGVYLARIQIAVFENYDYLEKYGETYYQPVEGASLTTANATVSSGYLEMANVQVVSEMVNMISVTRAYEPNQKIMQAYDAILDVAVNQSGRLK